MSKNPNSVNDRLQQANASGGGAPQIDPDQQRRYLGTFRERVSLAIKNKELDDSHARDALKQEFKKHPNYILLLNGNNSNAIKLEALASQYNVKADIKSQSDYSTDPDRYGAVFANSNHEAINQTKIDLYDKYPVNDSKSDSDKSSKASSNQHKTSFWQKIKNWF